MKNVAIAKITDPDLVKTKVEGLSSVWHEGSIFVEIPELNYIGTNLIYCRYGLAIPYIRIQVEDSVLVEPTLEDETRWFYTGFVDCGTVTPTTSDQLILQLASQVIYIATAGTMHLSDKAASEAFIKGTSAQVEMLKHEAAIKALRTAMSTWVPVANDGGAALKTLLAAFLALTMPDYSSILSTKIFGE